MKYLHVVVTRPDWIGRTAIETLVYLHQLWEHGVLLYTVRYGEIDVYDSHDFSFIANQAATAQMQTETSRDNSKQGVKSAWRKKVWKVRSNIVPLGYRLLGNGWLEVQEGTAEVYRSVVKFEGLPREMHTSGLSTKYLHLAATVSKALLS